MAGEPTICKHCQGKNFELLEDDTYECYDCGKTFEGDKLIRNTVQTENRDYEYGYVQRSDKAMENDLPVPIGNDQIADNGMYKYRFDKATEKSEVFHNNQWHFVNSSDFNPVCVTVYECDNCGHLDDVDRLPEAQDLSMRLSPGGMYTNKECPECGALCFPLDSFDSDASRLLEKVARMSDIEGVVDFDLLYEKLDEIHSLTTGVGQQAPTPAPNNQVAYDVVDFVLRHERADFEGQLGQSIDPLDESNTDKFSKVMNDYIETLSSDESTLWWLALNGNNHVYCDAARAMEIYNSKETT